MPLLKINGVLKVDDKTKTCKCSECDNEFMETICLNKIRGVQIDIGTKPIPLNSVYLLKCAVCGGLFSPSYSSLSLSNPSKENLEILDLINSLLDNYWEERRKRETDKQ